MPTLYTEMKKRKINADDFVNWWLEKYHNTNLDEVRKEHPEWEDGNHSTEFYKTYQVTQEQHDEWYDWAIKTILKKVRWSKKMAKRQFAFPYLDLSPSVKQNKK
jgi:hypothetical protein